MAMYFATYMLCSPVCKENGFPSDDFLGDITDRALNNRIIGGRETNTYCLENLYFAKSVASR